jgi:hypothetical protein
MARKPLKTPMSPIDVLLRWINVILRGMHLAAVVLLGAALLGAALDARHAATGVAITGFTMFALDLWRKPQYLAEVSGMAVLVKLGLVAWMAIDASSRHALFWLIVAGSAIFAHAPASFRHAVVLHRNKLD